MYRKSLLTYGILKAIIVLSIYNNHVNATKPNN